MTWIIIARIALTATFLILAAGGPWALIKLSHFIRQYTAAHKLLQDDHNTLKADHEALKERVAALEHEA